MKKRWLIIVVGVLISIFASLGLTMSAIAEDDGQGGGGNNLKVYCDVSMTEVDPMLCPKKRGNESKIEDKVKNVLNAVYLWIGIVAVVVIVVSGIRYISSQGNPEAVKKAKNGILYAAIGLIITVAAFAITNAILDALQGNV